MADQPLEDPAETAVSSQREPSGGRGSEKDRSEGTETRQLSAEGADRPLADLVKELRQEAESVLSEANRLSVAWLREAQELREEALARKEEAEQEARLLIEEAQKVAAELFQPETTAASRAATMLEEAKVTISNMIKDAEIEAERLVAEARRTEARILLDARARTDEVRSRLIRLYHEMEAAAATTWGAAGVETSHGREGT